MFIEHKLAYNINIVDVIQQLKQLTPPERRMGTIESSQ